MVDCPSRTIDPDDKSSRTLLSSFVCNCIVDFRTKPLLTGVYGSCALFWTSTTPTISDNAALRFKGFEPEGKVAIITTLITRAMTKTVVIERRTTFRMLKRLLVIIKTSSRLGIIQVWEAELFDPATK
jgi:hypothetical protein